MVLLEIGGMAVCFGLNLVFSHTGHNWKEDKDLFIPPASILFTFYPLIIALPEAHYKLINYSIGDNPQSSDINEDELFPYAFLISLLSITASMFIDKFLLREEEHEHEDNDDHKHLKEENWAKNKNTLQFLLTLSIALQNVVNYYFICVEPNRKQLAKEILLFLLFSLMTNFSHGYLLAQTGIDSKTNLKLSVFMNSGMIIGLIFSLFLDPDMTLLVIPCICAGLQIYCSIFICFPYIFTNGQRQKQDKSRYLAILIAFFATVIYYPICYFLRI